jgi:hypothetical protein
MYGSLWLLAVTQECWAGQADKKEIKGNLYKIKRGKGKENSSFIY